MDKIQIIEIETVLIKSLFFANSFSDVFQFGKKRKPNASETEAILFNAFEKNKPTIQMIRRNTKIFRI